MKLSPEDRKSLFDIIIRGSVEELSGFFNKFDESNKRQIIDDIYDISFLVDYISDYQRLIDEDNEVDYIENCTPLLYAVKNNKIEIIKFLIANGVDINKSGQFGITPLSEAITNNFFEIVQLLINNGADIEKADDAQITPIIDAVRVGSKKIVQLLLDKNAKVNCSDNHGQTPLIYAVRSANDEIVELLIKNNADIEKSDEDGYTPLIKAANCFGSSTIDLLIRYKADLNKVNKDGNSALMIATSNYNKKIAKSLIDSNADINLANKDGKTALLIACQKGSKNIVELLINSGADIEKADNLGFTPLILASSSQKDKVCKILIDNNAVLNKSDKRNYKASTYAIQKSNHEILQQLIDKDAGIDMFELEMAINKNDSKILSQLISYRPNLFYKSLYQNPIFDSALEVNNEELIKMLTNVRSIDLSDFNNDNEQNLPHRIFYDNHKLLEINGIDQSKPKLKYITNKILTRILERNNDIDQILRSNQDINIDQAKIEWLSSKIKNDNLDMIDFNIMLTMINNDQNQLFEQIRPEFNQKILLFLERELDSIIFDQNKSVENEVAEMINISGSDYDYIAGRIIHESIANIFTENNISIISEIDKDIDIKDFLIQVTKEALIFNRGNWLIKKFQESDSLDNEKIISGKILDWAIGLNRLFNYFEVGESRDINLLGFKDYRLNANDADMNCKLYLYSLLDELDINQLSTFKKFADIKINDCDDINHSKYSFLEINQYIEQRQERQRPNKRTHDEISQISESALESALESGMDLNDTRPNTNPSPTQFSQADQGRSRDLDSQMRM